MVEKMSTKIIEMREKRLLLGILIVSASYVLIRLDEFQNLAQFVLFRLFT